MILDAESLELVNAIEAMLEPAPARRDQARADGVGARDRDRPVPEHRRGRRAAARAAPPGARDGGRQGPGDRLRRHPSVRDVGGPAHRRAPALPRPDRGAAVRRPPGADLRACTSTSASTTPTRRSTSPTACASTCRCCSALSANSPFWRADATGLASTRTPIFRAFPRVGHPARLRRLGRLRAPDRVHGRRRGDRGLHLPLVRRPPAPELRHGRDPGDGLPDPRRAHARRSRR